MLLRSTCFLNRISTLRNTSLFNQIRYVTLRPAQFVVPRSETFEEKNAKLNRPLSPHLTIYKPQLTTTLSIFHRITGVAVTGYLLVIVASSSYHVETLITAINNLELSPGVLFTIKTVLALPVSYHAVNGVRHLIWDVGRGLKIKQVYISGYIMLVGSIILSLYLATI